MRFTSHEQDRIEAYVKQVATNPNGLNVVPYSIDGLIDRYEVEEFVRNVLNNQTYWIPQGLDFLGGVSWERLIKKAVSRAV